MITLKFEEVQTPNFANALRVLSQARGLDAHVAYRIGKMAKKVESFSKECGKEHEKIAKKYAYVDDEGFFLVRNEQGELTRPKHPGSFEVSDENSESFKNDLDALMATELSIDMWQLKIDDIRDAKLAPCELIALEQLLEDVEYGEKN